MTTPQPTPQRHGSSMEISGFSVVIVADFVDAMSINPDRLRKAGLIPEEAVVDPTSLVSPQLSHVSFDIGLAFTADPKKLTVGQAGANLDPNKLDCIRIAKELVEKFPVSGCKALGINPTGFVAIRGSCGESILNILAPGVEWITSEEVTPEIKMTVMYRSEDKTITLGIEPASSDRSGAIFHGNVHRDIRDAPEEERKTQLLSFLDSSPQDLDKFLALVGKFDFRRKSS